jgi:Fanconi anemia group J protein
MEIWDIEDIVTLGKATHGIHQVFIRINDISLACPYYAARAKSKYADIVFMPYNYLLDPAIRRHMELQIVNSVIIFDEAQ